MLYKDITSMPCDTGKHTHDKTGCHGTVNIPIHVCKCTTTYLKLIDPDKTGCHEMAS